MEIDGLPINSMVNFHTHVNVYQRVYNSMTLVGLNPLKMIEDPPF